MIRGDLVPLWKIHRDVVGDAPGGRPLIPDAPGARRAMHSARGGALKGTSPVLSPEDLLGGGLGVPRIGGGGGDDGTSDLAHATSLPQNHVAQKLYVRGCPRTNTLSSYPSPLRKSISKGEVSPMKLTPRSRKRIPVRRKRNSFVDRNLQRKTERP